MQHASWSKSDVAFLKDKSSQERTHTQPDTASVGHTEQFYSNRHETPNRHPMHVCAKRAQLSQGSS